MPAKRADWRSSQMAMPSGSCTCSLRGLAKQYIVERSAADLLKQREKICRKPSPTCSLKPAASRVGTRFARIRLSENCLREGEVPFFSVPDGFRILTKPLSGHLVQRGVYASQLR